MAVTGRDDALVDVAAVGPEDILAQPKPAKNREDRVEYKGPNHQHAEKKRTPGSGRIRAEASHHERQHGEGKAEKGAADVADEDAGRRPVMQQKAEAARRQQNPE